MALEVWPSVDVGRRLERGRLEWLSASGGGWTASSTLAGMHTRRQHGLLVAPVEPGGERFVVISHVDATLVAPGDGERPAATFELARHQFPGIDPAGEPFYLSRFAQDPLPRFVHEVECGELEVALGLAPSAPALALRYRFRGDRKVRLRLRPLLAMRLESELQRENGGMEQRVEMRSGEVRVRPRKDLPGVGFRCAGSFVGSPDWWRRFEYLEDRATEAAFSEDLWTPGVFELDLGEGEGYLVAALGRLPSESPAELFAAAEASAAAEDPGPLSSPATRRLSIAASAFCVERGAAPSIVLGFPPPRGQVDVALQALPGLLLARGRLPSALRVLRRLIERMRGGFLPERLAPAPSRAGRVERVSGVATLWLFDVARLVAARLGPAHPIVTDELLLALADAFEGLAAPEARGPPDAPARPAWLTESGLVALDPGDGSGDGPGEGPSEPRASTAGGPIDAAACPIELAALWARGAETLARLAGAAGYAPLAARAREACSRARTEIARRFWCEAAGYPFDAVPAREGAWAPDAAVRAGAVVALALDPASFSAERARAIVARARTELLTPAGLRDAAMGEAPGAVSPGARPHLLGAFVRASLAVGAPREELVALVEIALAAPTGGVLGHVPERALPEPPHAPLGRPADALCAAELLRALVFDLATT